MLFCKDCSRFLRIQEMIIDNKRDVYLYCDDCKTATRPKSYQFHIKYFQQKINNSDKVSNEIRSQDITLPLQKSTCPFCKKTQFNRFQRHYENNTFWIDNICKECYANF